MKKPSLSQETESMIFSKFEELGISVSAELKKSIQQRIQEINSYVPKVGVFGKTGVGKSSLCNALFGQDVCSISDVQACTRDPQEVLLTIGNSGQGIKLVDVPGVGEDRKRDDEYDALYKKLLPELDLIFWVFKGDDRANASDEDFYKRLIRPYIDAGKPFIAVINQVDKIEPFREWNEEENSPGIKQLKNIKEKCNHVANFLRLPVSQVIPISSNERYGLMELVDAIVHALPNEQKAIILQNIETADDIRKKAAAKAAEAARKEADEAIRKAEKAHRLELAAEKEEREKLEKMAREADRLRRQAEEAAEAAEIKAKRIENERVISRETHIRAKKSFLSSVLDVAEKIPRIGPIIKNLRGLFS